MSGATSSKVTMAMAAFSLAVTCSMADADTLTFVSWGGSTQQQQRHAWADAFTEETGIRVLQAGPTDYGRLKAMVESGNVEWDVVDVEAEFALRAASQGLLEPIDFSNIDKDELDPRFYFDYGVGSFYFSFVLGYNTNAVGDKSPSGWDALFDTKTYPGQRMLYKWPSPGALELALLADGVAPEDLYPLDVDRALAKLDTIKEHLVFWETGAQSQQLLASGEVTMGQLWNGRIYTLLEQKAPVAMDWSQNLAYADFLVVPKGTRNREAAMEFIALASSAKAQAHFANLSAYAPINREAVALLDADMAGHLASAHTESQVSLDHAYWAEHGEEIARRWNAWILK